MKQLRWYDKDLRLQAIFDFIQGFDKKTQDEVAKDMIQILLNDLNLNQDESLNELARQCGYDYNRWYDRNVDLFTAFELIKKLPMELRNQVVKKVAETVLLMYFEESPNE